jgi:hypothetical protein
VSYENREKKMNKKSKIPSTIEKKILNNLLCANRGLVFQDKKLLASFGKQWFYMPDPSYRPSTTDFTKFEHRLLESE